MVEMQVKMQHQPIEQIQMANKVCDATRDMIVRGVMEEGQRITEAYLSELFQVSRSPVREALKKLSYEGFVELLPYRGARVSVIKAKNVREHYQLKAMLDGYSCFLAAQTFSQEDLNSLKQVTDVMARYVAEGDFDGVALSNTKFHQFIVDGAKNTLLSQYYDSLAHNLRRYADLSLGDKERWGRILEEHQEVYDALVRSDGLAAFMAATRHASHAMERVLRKINTHIADTSRVETSVYL
ncbi:HTH-type transcriptional repressor RspR [bioreactor metagenome]|uniref:HTH-type transcriptional repressor RspR n=1 Tax=bioreactor metagenome TaxID=1076179 RepID=A0A644XIB8_9ZZZZ